MTRRVLVAVSAVMAAALAGPAEAGGSGQPRALSVAAAANLVFALDALNAEFLKAEPDVAVTTVSGASGGIVAQIEHGAPYDIFLSADLDYPRALIKAGQAEGRSLTTFAVGRLVLWTRSGEIDVSDIASAVRSPRVRKLAIANVTSAPYGRAAKQALEQLGAWADAQPKLVIGENISQTAQFVDTGNADAGFVALSLVLSPKLRDKGHWAEVPAGLYASLEQGAVITAHGSSNPAAQSYLEFLTGPAAQRVLEGYGYGIPGPR